MTFTYGEIKDVAKLSDATLATMEGTIFDARSDLAIKRAMGAYERTLEENDDSFGKLSTLSEVTVPVPGTEIANTTVGDLLQIQLIAAARKIADDTIFVYKPASAEFEAAKRIDIDDIVPAGGDATIIGFAEINGAFDLYVKQGTFAAFADVKLQYKYWRHLEVPDDDADELDIKPGDFNDVLALYLQYLTIAQ